MELEIIKKDVYQKIQSIFDKYFPLEKEFDEQILEIRKHFLAAIEGEFDFYRRPLADHLNHYHSWGIDDKIVRDRVQIKFNEAYIKTNSWVEKHFFEKDSLFSCLGSQEWKEKVVEEIAPQNLTYQWQLIENVGRYLKTEDLTKVKKYYINIFDSSHCLQPNQKKTNDYKYRVLIYLITSDRIITTSINNEKVLRNTEHIIQKDLKKVEIVDETTLQFHYHGLHDPDNLYLDSFEVASALRKEITLLRESRFDKPHTKR